MPGGASVNPAGQSSQSSTSAPFSVPCAQHVLYNNVVIENLAVTYTCTVQYSFYKVFLFHGHFAAAVFVAHHHFTSMYII